jgi:hypothetical protein
MSSATVRAAARTLLAPVNEPRVDRRSRCRHGFCYRGGSLSLAGSGPAAAGDPKRDDAAGVNGNAVYLGGHRAP